MILDENFGQYHIISSVLKVLGMSTDCFGVVLRDSFYHLTISGGRLVQMRGMITLAPSLSDLRLNLSIA